MAEESTKGSDEKLLKQSEVIELTFGGVKRYVKAVGLEVPKFATKRGLLVLIEKHNKWIKDVKKHEEPTNTEIDVMSMDKKIQSAIKRFRSYISHTFALRPIQSTCQAIKLSPDDMEKAILNFKIDQINHTHLNNLGTHLTAIAPHEWLAACAVSYNVAEVLP
eukprot:UN06706